MPKSHRPYPPESRQRIIELVRKGRTPEELARQFEPSAQAIRNWVRQADRDDGRRQDGLTTAEQEELRRLHRENRALREERKILKLHARDREDARLGRALLSHRYPPGRTGDGGDGDVWALAGRRVVRGREAGRQAADGIPERSHGTPSASNPSRKKAPKIPPRIQNAGWLI
jgi:transposase